MKPFTRQLYNPTATKYNIGISTKRGLIDQQRNSIAIQPGHIVLVNVLPRLFTTTADFNDLKRNQRKCKLPHETEGFQFLKEYSRSGCEFECAVQKAISLCKCLPWYYPNDFTEWPICEMFSGYCFDMIMSDNTYYKQCIGQCMRDCEETAFMVIPSSVPLDLDHLCYFKGFLMQHFEKNFNKHFAFKRYQILVDGSGSISDLVTSFTNGSLCKDYVKNYVSFVRVESPISKILLTKKDRRIYFYDQLGTFGGTFGLFMGGSVICMFELCFLVLHIFIAILMFLYKLIDPTKITSLITDNTDETYQEKIYAATKIKQHEQKLKVSLNKKKDYSKFSAFATYALSLIHI